MKFFRSTSHIQTPRGSVRR